MTSPCLPALPNTTILASPPWAPPPQVLYDLGVVSTPEPFQRLVSQGMILGEVEYSLHRHPTTGDYCSEDTRGALAVRWALLLG